VAYLVEIVETAVELRSRAKCGRNLTDSGRDKEIFSSFEDGVRRHLGFLFLSNFNGRNARGDEGTELRRPVKFGRNRLNCGRDMVVFYFSRWRPQPSWIINFFEILTVGTFKRAELRRLAKFGRNPSNRGRDMVIFLSRVCAVAQYAALEANGKVNGIGKNSNPDPSPTLGPIWMSLQIYHYVRPGSRCAKFD